MTVDYGAAWRAWASYGRDPKVNAFLLARFAVLPLGALTGELREMRGQLLSIGAGHGLLERYATELDPAVSVVGLELDPERVRTAARSQHRAPRVTLRTADVTAMAPEEARFDGALAIDVLHHIPFAEQAGLLRSLVGVLAPGAALVVKDIARTPKWKHDWNARHDRLVAKEEVHCRDPEDLASMLEDAGLLVERAARLAPMSPYPHYVVRGRTAPSAD